MLKCVWEYLPTYNNGLVSVQRFVLSILWLFWMKWKSSGPLCSALAVLKNNGVRSVSRSRLYVVLAPELLPSANDLFSKWRFFCDDMAAAHAGPFCPFAHLGCNGPNRRKELTSHHNFFQLSIGLQISKQQGAIKMIKRIKWQHDHVEHHAL